MAETVRKTHPFAGGLWGLIFGIGLAVFVINARWVSLSVVSLVVFVVIGIVLGVVWSTFGPAKKPKGQSPSTEPSPDPTPVAAEPEADQPSPDTQTF